MPSEPAEKRSSRERTIRQSRPKVVSSQRNVSCEYAPAMSGT
jgi:hypothetical protein